MQSRFPEKYGQLDFSRMSLGVAGDNLPESSSFIKPASMSASYNVIASLFPKEE
jgi:hypothetical protein